VRVKGQLGGSKAFGVVCPEWDGSCWILGDLLAASFHLQASTANNSPSPDQSYMGYICTTSLKRRRKQSLACDRC
jgi:hypothetical protein